MNVDILLPYISDIVLFEVHGEKAVKMVQPKESAHVDELDKAWFHVQLCTKKLDEQENKYHITLNTLRSKAMEYYKQGNKSRAIATLKSAHLYDAQISRCLKSKEIIFKITMELEQCQANTVIVKAMEEGTKALGLQLAEMGGVERVEDLMDSVSELISRQNDITQALMPPMGEFSAQLTADEMQEFGAELENLVTARDATLSNKPSISGTQEQDERTTADLIRELESIHIPQLSLEPPSSSAQEQKPSILASTT